MSDESLYKLYINNNSDNPRHTAIFNSLDEILDSGSDKDKLKAINLILTMESHNITKEKNKALDHRNDPLINLSSLIHMTRDFPSVQPTKLLEENINKSEEEND